MGLIRKTMSMGTLGAVDYRSDKERIARYTKQTRNAVRAGNQNQAEAEWRTAQLAGYTGPPAPPQGGYATGWYIDEHDPRFVRWWDPTGPSQHVQPIPPVDAPALPPPGYPAALPTATPPAGASLGDELTRLAELRAQGVLSDGEFAAAKARLLGS